MKRKRKPLKMTRRAEHGPSRPTKGRQKTHLSRYINEEIE